MGSKALVAVLVSLLVAVVCYRYFGDEGASSVAALPSIPREIEETSPLGIALFEEYMRDESLERGTRVSFLYHANGYLESALNCYALLDKGTPRTSYLHALALLDMGFQKEAVGILDALRVQGDAPIFVSLRLGAAFLRLGEVSSAEQVYADVLNQEDGNIHALIGSAQVAIARGKSSAAIEILEVASQRLEVPSTVYALLGQAYHGLGRSEDSRLAFEKSYRSDEYSEFDDVWYDALLLDYCFDANLLLSNAERATFSGLIDRSAEFVDRALAVVPDDPRVLVEFAIRQTDQGNAREAVDTLRRALELDPYREIAYEALSRAHVMESSYARAVVVLDEGLSLVPKSARLHSAIGQLYLERNDDVKAHYHLEKAVMLEPNGIPQKKHFGMLLLRSGLESGFAMLEEYSKLQPDDSEAALVLSLSYARKGALDKAQYVARRHERALGAASEKFRLAYASEVQQLVMGQVRGGNLPLAIGYQEESLAFWPENPEGRANLGMLKAQLGQFDAAIQALEEFTASDPQNPLGWLNLGKAHIMNRDRERARSAWLKGLALPVSNGKEQASRSEIETLLERFGE